MQIGVELPTVTSAAGGDATDGKKALMSPVHYKSKFRKTYNEEMQMGVELPTATLATVESRGDASNGKKTPVMSPVHYGQDVYQRSLSESEYLSRAKRPRYELPENVQNAYESKKYHRLIEKRRRDRINECIYQLKDLLPADVIKSTSKPMEKAVILELVVQYMQSINQKNKSGRSQECTAQTQRAQDAGDQGLSTDSGYRECSDKSRGSSSLPPLSSKGTGESDESSREKQFTSSSSGSSCSPVSDFSLCADNSDSSGYQAVNVRKLVKRKVYSHHQHSSNHKSNNVSQPKRQATSEAVSVASPAQTPVFINMPFMMTPNMMPQFMSPDGTPITSKASMPRMVQSFPVNTHTGMMVPQMSTDANGMQFPMCFMQMPQQMTEGQPQQQPQASQVEQVMMQPTMMMPMRNQGNFVFMPSYPMMPQFQAPTLVSVQTSAEEQTSPSE